MLLHSGVLAAEAPFGLNIGLFIGQLVNFLILWFILARFVFPALFKTLDERSATIQEGVANAHRAREDVTNAEKRAQEIIQEAQRRSQQIIADGTANGERIRAQIETEARTRADDILKQAQVRIQQEEAQAKNSLREQVADLAIFAAGQVIGESLDGPRQRKIVQDAIAQSEVK